MSVFFCLAKETGDSEGVLRMSDGGPQLVRKLPCIAGTLLLRSLS